MILTINSRSLFLAIGCCAVAAIRAAASELQAADLSLRCVPSATAFSVGDPLFIKVILRNESDQPLGVNHLLMDGSADFEAKGAGTSEFIRVASSHPAAEVITTNPMPVRLASHEEYAIYEQIFLDARRSVALPDAGTFDIRSRLRINGQLITSPPLQISIAPSSPRQRDAIRRSFSTIDLLISTGSPVSPSDYRRFFKDLKTKEQFLHQYHDDARILSKQLDDGILRRTAEWSLAAEELRDASNIPSALKAWEKLQHVQLAVDPVTKEVINLLAGGQFAHFGQWDVASERINQIKTRSYKRDWIKLQIDIAQGRAADPSKALPKKKLSTPD